MIYETDSRAYEQLSMRFELSSRVPGRTSFISTFNSITAVHDLIPLLSIPRQLARQMDHCSGYGVTDLGPSSQVLDYPMRLGSGELDGGKQIDSKSRS